MEHSDSASTEATTSAERLSPRTILSYAAGQLGLNVTYTSIGMHLTFFYSDVIKVSPSLVAIALLVGNAWDAITDPVMGHISDRVRWKRGRRRPFFGLGATPMALTFLLIFSPDTLSARGWLAFYLTAVIVLLFTFRTIVETPYIALAPELSLDYNERTRISAFRQLFATVGDIIGAMGPLIALQIFVSRTGAYSAFGIVAAFLTIVGFVAAYRGTTESGQFSKKSSLSFTTAFKATLTNKPFLIIVATLMLTIIANNCTVALVLFIAKYWFLSEALATNFMVAFFIGAFASIPFWIRLAATVGKKAAYIIDITLYGILLCAIFILKQDAHLAATFIMGVAGFFNLGLWILSGSIVADVVEWDQLRTGERREGAFAGIQSFIIKAAQGVGLALVNVALDIIGYVPDVPQSAATLRNLKILYGLVPGVIFWTGAAIFLFYPITKKTHALMLAEIKAKAH
ncbi:MAG: MFS transporter [Candidatus Abyssobacteria bacterium SURF_17]|uniref:MFS transporter n=1 Tax=Candidatus Abyssobacteria bacterium SURF_17 TaxID=2093361 RepID=A0A419EXL6_9BACT|nr:MAG: MFS transporter [Candidatus Abyssubacteria bacterium SURF_17]